MEKDNSLIDKILADKWLPFSIVAVLGILIYGRSFFFGFTYLDDNALILDSQYFLGNLTNIFRSFVTDVFHLTSGSAFYYRPMLTITLMLDYQIGGISPFIYHFTNVALHIAVSYLVFVFLTKLNYQKTVSFLFSLIFLVHPVLSQAVAWIPGRNDSLLTFFLLLSFIYLINFFGRKTAKNFVLHLLFFALAIFTKETALFAFFIFFFYFYFIRKEKGVLNKKYFFAGWGVVFILWFVLRQTALFGSSPMDLINAAQSIFFNLPAVLQLVGKIIFPFNLSVLPIVQDTTFIYGTVAIILLIALILFTRNKRWNFILFGFLWFFAFLLPSFIRPNSALVADFIEHRLYLPIIGFFIILLETGFIRSTDIRKKTDLAIASCLILAFGIIAIVHSGNFADRLAFWENAAENSPHYPLARRNLGAMRYLDGDMDGAEKEYMAALLLNPEEPMVHNNLGLVYANKNKFKEAEEEYKKELEINPNYDNAYFNLGLLYFAQERYDEAVENWKKALDINPNHSDALNALNVINQLKK